MAFRVVVLTDVQDGGDGLTIVDLGLSDERLEFERPTLHDARETAITILTSFAVPIRVLNRKNLVVLRFDPPEPGFDARGIGFPALRKRYLSALKNSRAWADMIREANQAGDSKKAWNLSRTWIAYRDEATRARLALAMSFERATGGSRSGIFAGLLRP